MIGAVALIVFGLRRLTEMMKTVGKAKKFKKFRISLIGFEKGKFIGSKPST
ncbi:MAG: twin-arginine translocase TatA/TatE family subunit [Acidobacteriota bacterium]|nr:twin-arginine translocase TatA/TatE family subunit [Acidobacteriota bacterium]